MGKSCEGRQAISMARPNQCGRSDNPIRVVRCRAQNEPDAEDGQQLGSSLEDVKMLDGATFNVCEGRANGSENRRCRSLNCNTVRPRLSAVRCGGQGSNGV